MRPPSRRLPLIAILATLAIFGCSRQEPQKGGESKVTRLPDVLSYAEPTVGKSDTLVNTIAPALSPWMILWRHAYSGFQPDSLIRFGVAPMFRGGPVQPLRELYPPSKEHQSAFRILSARSPDGRYDLIFDSYLCVEADGDKVDISGEPESAPALLDLRRKTAKRFDGFGGVNWGAWASPTRFVLTGTQYEGRNMGIRGWVQVYSLRDSTVTTYVTRPLHSSRAAAYRSAWESWVAMRYHATKQVASRS